LLKKKIEECVHSDTLLLAKVNRSTTPERKTGEIRNQT